MKRDRSREKRRVHENTLSKWQFVRDLARLGEFERNCRVVGRSFVAKGNLHIGDAQPRLINNHRCRAIGLGGECDDPRPFARPPMLDTVINQPITSQGNQERSDKMLERIVTQECPLRRCHEHQSDENRVPENDKLIARDRNPTNAELLPGDRGHGLCREPRKSPGRRFRHN